MKTACWKRMIKATEESGFLDKRADKMNYVLSDYGVE